MPRGLSFAIGLFCALLSVGVTKATAQETRLTRLDTGDQTRGWEAVGRLDIDGRGFCTGALIALPVLRAAVATLASMATFEEAGIDT